VDTRIAELRRALGDDPAQPTYIETVPGQGYRFVGAVEVAA
jgi:DNA-binding winged helix-turn-helix (wHTH) protein